MDHLVTQTQQYTNILISFSVIATGCCTLLLVQLRFLFPMNYILGRYIY